MKPENVRLNSKVVEVKENEDEDGVEVRLSDRAVEKDDVLIGPDGLHSMVREELFTPDKPRSSGCVAWRALAW